MSAALNPNHRRGRAPCGHVDCPEAQCRFVPCSHAPWKLSAIERDGQHIIACSCGHEEVCVESAPWGPKVELGSSMRRWNEVDIAARARAIQRRRV